MRERKVTYFVLAGAVAGAASLLCNAPVARATIFTGSYDTVYADNFAAPAINVNSATTDPNAIVGNVPVEPPNRDERNDQVASKPRPASFATETTVVTLVTDRPNTPFFRHKTIAEQRCA